MATTEVPDIVIGRLPIYLRALTLMKPGRNLPRPKSLDRNLASVRLKSAKIYPTLVSLANRVLATKSSIFANNSQKFYMLIRIGR